MDSSAQSINDQLCYGDQNATNPLVADAQYLLPIADHDQIDVLRIPPLIDVVLDAIHVFDVEEAAFGAPEQPRVVCDGVALGGGVDDGEHLLEVIEDEAVVEYLILLLHGRHECVFSQIVRPRTILIVGAPGLLVEGLDVGREEAMELKSFTLFLGEG